MRDLVVSSASLDDNLLRLDFRESAISFQISFDERDSYGNIKVAKQVQRGSTVRVAGIRGNEDSQLLSPLSIASLYLVTGERPDDVEPLYIRAAYFPKQ